MGFFKNLKLKNAFKSGKLLHINEIPLQIDRDIFLVEQSSTRNIPIVVGKQERFDQLKIINANVEILRIAPVYTIEFRDVEFAKGVLIDQSVSRVCIDWLGANNIKISGGFSES